MHIQDVKFTLKDGREAILKTPIVDDAEGMVQFLKYTAAETHFLTREPKDCWRYKVPQEREWLNHAYNSDEQYMIVCYVDHKLVACCEINWRNYSKVRHRATCGICVLKEFWGQGIGRKMFEEMIRIAREDEEITQMELSFTEGNDRGRKLYESLGFRLTGVKPNAIKMPDGQLVNEYLMIKDISI